jgi:hypothetical protein
MRTLSRVQVAAVIMLSVLIFGTQLTAYKAAGIGCCMAGIALFNFHKSGGGPCPAASSIGHIISSPLLSSPYYCRATVGRVKHSYLFTE